MSKRRVAVGITGASGAILARTLCEELLRADCEVHLTASKSGRLVVSQELGGEPRGRELFPELSGRGIIEWSEKDYMAPFASGSSKFHGMAIIPCSMSTVGSIASGLSDNLLRRGADVMLKERRPLVLVPREAPLSDIHLQNLLTCARAGTIIIPPVLTFYQSPTQKVGDQVEFVVSRVLDHLGIDNELYQRWDMT